MKKLIMFLTLAAMLTLGGSVTLPHVSAQSVPECSPCAAQQAQWADDLWDLYDNGYISGWQYAAAMIQIYTAGTLPAVLQTFYDAADNDPCFEFGGCE